MTLLSSPKHRALVIPLLALFLVAWGCGQRTASEDAKNAGAGAAAAEADDTDEGDNVATDGDETSGEESKDEPSKRTRERTTSVSAAKAVRGTLVIPVTAEGAIRARHSAELATEASGRIVDVRAREGQVLQRGSLILKLDDREAVVALEEARAKYFQALSLLAIEEDSLTIPERPAHLQREVEELKRLEASGVITREERLLREVALDVRAIRDGSFRADVVTARSGIATARAELERARLALERTEIRAPFSGIVTGLNLSEGQQVAIGRVVCTLINLSDIEAEVGVLESDIGKIEVGRRALLDIPSLGELIDVKVDVISPHVDRESRTCQVLLRLNNEDGRVRPGMYVRALIAGETFHDRLVVPRAAILTRDGRPLLFKAEEDHAKWLYVSLGAQNDQLVEVERVLQGGALAENDLVVVSDHLTLAHDAKIKVSKIVSVEDPWAATD